jgi:hypothetical protein
MSSQHQARLPIPIARIWIDAAREQISHYVCIAPPYGILPTYIHSIDSLASKFVLVNKYFEHVIKGILKLDSRASLYS